MKLLNKCNFCNSSDFRLHTLLHNTTLGKAEDYYLVECQNCGLLFLNPQPIWEELVNYYDPSQALPKYHCFIEAPQDQRFMVTRWAQNYGLRRRCEKITHRVNKGRILDIGCATGIFLNAMQQLPNWEVVGLEPVTYAANYAHDRFGFPVYNKTLLEANFPETSFDVITLWDVLEHVDNPSAYLEKIYRILKPGGWLVIKIPDPSSLESQWFGADWVGYDVPFHLYSFPRYLMIDKLTELGFNLIEKEQIGGDYASFLRSLSAWFFSRKKTRLSLFTRHLATSTSGRIVTAPLMYTMRRIGVTSSITFFAKKKK